MNKQEAIKRVEELLGYGSRAKVVTDIISQIDQPQPVVVPKVVAEWIESEKSRKRRLSQALSSVFDELELSLYIKQQLGDYTEIIARAWLDGYEVEQEQLYAVELFNGQPLVEVNNILYFSSDLAAVNARVSKDKLELAGFGWVFDCDGVKVEEVE